MCLEHSCCFKVIFSKEREGNGKQWWLDNKVKVPQNHWGCGTGPRGMCWSVKQYSEVGSWYVSTNVINPEHFNAFCVCFKPQIRQPSLSWALNVWKWEPRGVMPRWTTRALHSSITSMTPKTPSSLTDTQVITHGFYFQVHIRRSISLSLARAHSLPPSLPLSSIETRVARKFTRLISWL